MFPLATSGHTISRKTKERVRRIPRKSFRKENTSYGIWIVQIAVKASFVINESIYQFNISIRHIYIIGIIYISANIHIEYNFKSPIVKSSQYVSFIRNGFINKRWMELSYKGLSLLNAHSEWPHLFSININYSTNIIASNCSSLYQWSH